MATYLINFYPHDADAVEAGTRRQVMREHRKDGRRIRVGDTLKLYVRLRTSYGRLLKQVRCDEAMSVRLTPGTGLLVIDGAKCDADTLHDIAVREGYTDGYQLRERLAENLHGADFDGYLVRW